MKNKKVIIACSIATVLIFSLILFLLLRGKGDTPDSTSAEGTDTLTKVAMKPGGSDREDVYTYIQENIKQVWFFSTDGSFPPWSQPVPHVNPMGDEDNYTDVTIEKSSYHIYDYADGQNTLISRYVYGDKWIMHIPFDDKKTPDENRQFILDIEHYIRSNNGDITGYHNNSIVFILTDGNDIRWWAEAVITGEQIILNIVKQDDIKVGQTLVINTEDYEENLIRFSSFNPGNEYQSIHLEYDKGEVGFEISTENRYGSYKRVYTTRDTLYDELSTDFYYDSIMYDPGFSNWEVFWRDPEETGEIKITLLKTGEIPEIKYGEPLGAIKVSSEYVSGMKAYPVGNASLNIEHPEFSYDDFYLDQTPDGDYIMFVPAGLWDVQVYPEGNALVSVYETLMVPVHSGEMTTVDVPFNISNALKTGSSDYNDRGIRIGAVKEDQSKNQVTFSFTLLDKDTKEILPGMNNTTITESGAPVKLVSVERAKIPPDVVLLLDSSGSMMGQMQGALNAAGAFVKGLPDDAKIRIVDFDDQIRELKGETKEDALNNLSAIYVGGDTALYNAIDRGLGMLAGESRPILVVFTDGENDLIYGDSLTLAETTDLVREAGIPLFTIGFGKGHDSATLESLAKVSDGQYFSADDGEALNNVFSSINERIGSTFEATYERPLESSSGDIPVVSFVIDTSGSMIQDTSENFGSRIHNVKKLIRRFILELPDEVQMQLTEFNEDTKIVQALTTDKMKILRGLGRLEASGPTDITGSVLASYKTLKSIPSTKKVLVYITDAALGTTSPDNDFFLSILEDMKEDDINILWVGLGLEDEEEDFRLAAEITDGEYIVTEDIALLTESFNKVLREVQNAPQSGLSNLFIGIEKVNDMGARESYSTAKLAELSPVRKGTEVVIAETIKYTAGKILRQYDAHTADYISGCSVPAQDTIITKRMSAEADGANTAARISAEGIFFMKRLKGVDAPSNYRFMAVTMEMKNILEPQEVTIYPDGSSHPSSWVDGSARGKTQFIKIPYMIPDFTSHFFLSYNNEGAYPGSLATWLTEKPLALPGDNAIIVLPDESIDGTLVFLVPDVPMSQSSLHFYDINYGHIDIPIVGKMNKNEFDITSLPKQEPAKLTDTFLLDITGYEEIMIIPGTGKNASGIMTGTGTYADTDADTDANTDAGVSSGSSVTGSDSGDVGVVPAAGSVFKIVEGNFTSQMQALLNIDPMERFSLRLCTDSGDFYVPVNPATNLLPAGFVSPRMISPGSFNKIRWLFELPEGLKNNTVEIFADLRDEDKTAHVFSGALYPGDLNAEYKSEYIDLTVNSLIKTKQEINGYSGEYIIADITIYDKKDGYASAGIGSLFSSVSDEYFTMAGENTSGNTENSENDSGLYEESGETGLGNFAQSGGEKSTVNRLLPDRLTEQIILGYTDDSIVYDGTGRRGIIIFQVPAGEEKEWYLYSETFEGLKLKVINGTYNMDLLGEKIQIDTDDTFTQNLNSAISLTVEKYRLDHPENTTHLATGNIPLGEPAADKQDIPIPAITTYGARLIDEINSVEDMIAVMKQLRYIPSSGGFGPFNYSFSKEALMTQGFGMEQDYANMAVEVLSKLGYHPKMKVVRLTDRGKTELSKMSGIDEIMIDTLPAVSYNDNENNYHVLVMPFMEDLNILKRLVYIDYEHSVEKAPNTINLVINAGGYLTEKGAREHTGDMADALGGDTEGAPVLVSELLYDNNIDLDILSLDAIDIGIAKDGNTARVYLITPEGEIFGEKSIDTEKIDVKQIEIVLNLPNRSGVTHVVRLDEGMEIDDIFMTVSINSPDLTDETALMLQEASSKVHAQAKNPGELSALRWYGRSLIYKFISLQTIHDHALIDSLDLTAGRTQKPRVIIVTQKAGGKLQTSISLLQIHDEIHAGKEDAIRRFNILSGIYASTLETTVLPDTANGLEEIWVQAPEGTSLVLLDYISDTTMDDMVTAGLPEDVIKHFSESSCMVLIPDKPSIIDGRPKWAWYEINPNTHEMISVIDTLEKGAFVESAIVDIVKSAGQYAVGAFKGVETSIWSVAAFSLEKDDYNDILKAAKALALGIADRFGFNVGPIEGGVGSKISVSQAMGPVKFSFDGSASASQNVLGFTDGYKAGVEYYFSEAK